MVYTHSRMFGGSAEIQTHIPDILWKVASQTNPVTWSRICGGLPTHIQECLVGSPKYNHIFQIVWWDLNTHSRLLDLSVYAMLHAMINNRESGACGCVAGFAYSPKHYKWFDVVGTPCFRISCYELRGVHCAHTRHARHALDGVGMCGHLVGSSQRRDLSDHMTCSDTALTSLFWLKKS